MPTSKQFDKVLKKLHKVLPMARRKGQLDMSESAVNNYGHVCGTVHCFGGWYAVAACDLSRRLDYEHGANQLAKDLGFELKVFFKDWADENPILWGNRHGGYMFSEDIAFTPGDKSHAANLRDIYDHLFEVRDRVWLEEQIINEEKINQL